MFAEDPVPLNGTTEFQDRLDPGGGMSIHPAGLHEALCRSRIQQISVTGTSSTLALLANPTMAPRSIVLQALLLTACLLGRLRAGWLHATPHVSAGWHSAAERPPIFSECTMNSVKCLTNFSGA